MKFVPQLFLFIFLTALSVQAQKLISAKLIDSTTQKPIPFATIAFNKFSGVISNDQGYFQLRLKKERTTDSLFISCLGYENKSLSAFKFSDSIIFLKPQSIALNEVLISNKNYTVEEIIEKTYENISKNYDFDYNKSKLFYRESFFTKMLKSTIQVKKSTIPEINQKFIDSVITLLPKRADDYTEILGNLYTKGGPETKQKLDVIKAAHLYDKSKELNFDGLEERFNTIFKKHIKRDSYFKIKSGIFGTKEAIDSSLFDSSDIKKAETDVFLEEKKKQEQERKKHFLKHHRQSISDLETDSFIFEDSRLNFLEKSRKYDFKLLDYIFLNDNFVYKISFTPKRSAEYKGILYINTNDFAIVRVDYKNTKPIKNFNLLGISYREHLHEGTLIYAKTGTENYTLKYAESRSGNKFGVKRPFKIIEKNKHTRGRRKQNEVATNVHFAMSFSTKKELVVFESNPINIETYNNYKEKAETSPTDLPKYDPDFWKDYNIIEPNQAIKDFKSIDSY